MQAHPAMASETLHWSKCGTKKEYLQMILAVLQDIVVIISFFISSIQRHRGRVVKAVDSKSTDVYCRASSSLVGVAGISFSRTFFF